MRKGGILYGKARAANGHRCRHLPESKTKKEQKLRRVQLDATMAGAARAFTSVPSAPAATNNRLLSPLPLPLNPKHSFIL